MSYLKYELEFNYSTLQDICKIFETADNNLMMWILITETYPQTLLVCQWYVCWPQHPAARSTGGANDVITSWWSRASWSKFYVLDEFLCVGVTFSLPWRDFIVTLSDIIQICGHAMSDVITLWWSRESWYDFFLRLGWNFRLGGILFLLVSFYTLVQSTKSSYDFPSFWIQFSFQWDFISFGVVRYLGVINCILVWFSLFC